jgi:replication-associated recombination protein RarA
MEDRGMNTYLNDDAIDEIVAACNGDIRGALKALMLVNERLESELQQLYAVVGGIGPVERRTSALH